MAAPDDAAIHDYRRDGFVVARALFSPEETARYRDHFTAMLERGGDGWAEGGVDPTHADPLRRYPRLLQPHRGDAVAMGYLLEPRVWDWLAALAGRDPLGVQTMVYFKAPGARGQALHQDQRYLRAEPGTCLAAWLALDDTDAENGCLEVVPGSHEMPLLCPGESNPETHWSGDEIPPPPGYAGRLVPMRAGDVIFFHGNLIHGSGPNRSATRFRRILVGHYIEGNAERVAHYYFPVFDRAGRVVEGLEKNPFGGGPCSVPRETETGLEYVPFGSLEEAKAAH